MLNINPDILDEITRYVTGDLSPADQSKVAEKIASNEAYRLHLEYYKTIIAALAATNTTQPKLKSGSDEANLYFDALIAKDRNNARLYRAGYFTGFLVLIVAAFLLGRFMAPAIPATLPPILPSDPPFANVEEEEEEPLSSAGNAQPITIAMKHVKMGQQQILLASNNSPDIQYSFRNNSLRLFASEEKKNILINASIELIVLEQKGASLNYLKVDNNYYILEASNIRQKLIQVTDEGVLQTLQ